MIVVEDKLKAILDQLPLVPLSTTGLFKPVFMWGSQRDLIATLKLYKSSQKPYPLVWLITPYKETHDRLKKRVDVENMSIILAVPNNSQMLPIQRLETSFKQVLIPLFENVQDLFRKASTVSSDQVYGIEKHYNYGGDDQKTGITDIWDVLKFDINMQINDRCLNKMVIPSFLGRTGLNNSLNAAL